MSRPSRRARALKLYVRLMAHAIDAPGTRQARRAARLMPALYGIAQGKI